MSKKFKIDMFKMDVGHSGIDYRVATLSKLFLTITGNIIKCFKTIGQF